MVHQDKLLKVFYNTKQSTNSNTTVGTFHSPSAGKPAKLVEQWLATKQPIEVIKDWKPATKEQFYRAHERTHVDDVLACRKNNGFYNRIPGIARTLPWTTGSLLAAAIYAFENSTIAMSPTSGFHHATQNECMGFCTFNGLMVAALELHLRGAKRVGILDLDHHFGNGTSDIIKWRASKTDINMDIMHYTVGGDKKYNKEAPFEFGGRDALVWRGGDSAEKWLIELPEIVDRFKACDIVLYQAGADPHIDDPCHAIIHAVGALTNEQLKLRDNIVFEGLRGTPTTWNLAGGYQVPIQKVLDIHTRTLEECLKVL